MNDFLDSVSGETFKQQLHTSFRVQGANLAPVSLELVAVNEPPSTPGVEVFSLHFHGPSAPRLPQQIWRFQHDTMGAFDLFITAISGDAGGITYEAVFHRLLKKRP